jgi:hypothetical protein
MVRHSTFDQVARYLIDAQKIECGDDQKHPIFPTLVFRVFQSLLTPGCQAGVLFDQ